MSKKSSDMKSNNSKKPVEDNLSLNSMNKTAKKEEVVNESNNNNNNIDNKNAKPAIGSTRQYLEQTVVNVVMQGMAQLAKDRPSNPLEYLGNYLIERSKEE